MCFCKSHVSKTVLLIGQRSPVYVLGFCSHLQLLLQTLFQMFQRLCLHSCPNWSMTLQLFTQHISHYGLWCNLVCWSIWSICNNQTICFQLGWDHFVLVISDGLFWVQLPSSYIPKPTELNEKTLHSKTNTSNEPDMIMYLVKIPLNLVILDWFFFFSEECNVETRDTSSLHISKQLQNILFSRVCVPVTQY